MILDLQVTKRVTKRVRSLNYDGYIVNSPHAIDHTPPMTQQRESLISLPDTPCYHCMAPIAWGDVCVGLFCLGKTPSPGGTMITVNNGLLIGWVSYLQCLPSIFVLMQ